MFLLPALGLNIQEQGCDSVLSKYIATVV